MKNKKILFGKEARDKLASGASLLAQSVVSTLGPRSRNVAIYTQEGPFIVHDGVTVAKNIKLADPFEDMGAALVRESSVLTNIIAGDGTTTAALLANILIQKGLKMVGGGVSKEGVIGTSVNPMALKDRLAEYSSFITKELEKQAIPVTDIKQMEQIATISSGYADLGKTVAEVVKKVGKEGLVMVEEGSGFEVTVDYQQGMEFENGYLSPYFVTDAERMIVEYTGEHYVLLTDYSIMDAMQLVPIVEEVIKEGGGKKALLVIANDVVGPALQALVATKMKVGAPLVAVMAPEYADRRKEMLNDLALLTGANVISADKKDVLSEVKLSDLGRARNIKITATHTMITPLHPDTDEIKDRCDAIKKQIDEEKNDFRKERLQYRLAKLAGGVAIISVGGKSTAEIKEKKERVIDAVNATKAAVSEGLVPGGGIALRNIGLEFIKQKEAGGGPDQIDEFMLDFFEGPFVQILTNSGDSPEKITELLKDKPSTFGWDVVTKKVVDMIEAGITDPVKVTKMAVQHSISVASMVLTTDVLVAEEEDKEVQKMQIMQ